MGLIEGGNFAALELYGGNAGKDLDAVRQLTEALRARDSGKARRICSGPDEGEPVEPLCLVVLSDLGEFDAAFARAELIFPRMKGRNRAEEEKLWLDHPNGPSTGILSAPSAAALRRDKRFIGLAERVGLLDYWRSGRPPDFCRKAREPVCAQMLR